MMYILLLGIGVYFIFKGLSGISEAEKGRKPIEVKVNTKEE